MEPLSYILASVALVSIQATLVIISLVLFTCAVLLGFVAVAKAVKLLTEVVKG